MAQYRLEIRVNQIEQFDIRECQERRNEGQR